MKYLHETSRGMFYLDHRLVPEVSAMFCAMASRAPVGGIQARYKQVVEAVAESCWDAPRSTEATGFLEHTFLGGQAVHNRSWEEAKTLKEHGDEVGRARFYAEDRLCEYPLHPKVQKFFDDFVGKYGHSSIMELTGQPAVYSEGISWLTAWLLFDSPLCAGQEFSTRAVQHKDWPIARECEIILNDGHEDDGAIGHNPDLSNLHRDWFEVFEAEVAWWKIEFTSACPACEGEKFVGQGFKNPLTLSHKHYGKLTAECEACQGTGKKYPSADKEPFRPALDRARWALPGTIATGCAHTSPLRERSRVIRDGSLLAQSSKATSTETVWKEIAQTYREALPGLAGMGLREAVYSNESQVPGHLRTMFSDAPDGPDAEIEASFTHGLSDVRPFARTKEKSYVDPLANTVYHVEVTFRCSLAVSRDWHRHRTMYPWHLQVVRDGAGDLQIDHHYEPKSDLAKAKVPELLRRSTAVFDAFMSDGNIVMAGLALPLGTRVQMRGHGGLRDAIYMLELRKFAHGANFEYQDQATQALDLLRADLKDSCLPYGDENILTSDVFGLEPK